MPVSEALEAVVMMRAACGLGRSAGSVLSLPLQGGPRARIDTAASPAGCCSLKPLEWQWQTGESDSSLCLLAHSDK